MDVRANDRVDDAAAESFEAVESACQAVGWEFGRVGAPEPVFSTGRAVDDTPVATYEPSPQCVGGVVPDGVPLCGVGDLRG